MKKYETIYEDLRCLIFNNTLKYNDVIPSETKLSAKYKVSRVTVRRALKELENDHLIQKHQGRGSIVIHTINKNKTVLLILPDIFKYIFIDLLKGIEVTLRNNNISLLIANSFNDRSIEKNIIKNHLSKVDAIIFEPTQVKNTSYIGSKTYSKLLLKPTVCINASIPEFNLPSFTLDDKKNMELVTSYVLNKNVQRILILSKSDDLQGYTRLSGIKKVLETSKIQYKIVEFTTETENNRFEDFSFLYFHFKPDCIMFYNDEYAYKFMSKYNINPIIDNILITGFDNTEYSNGHPYRFISPNHPKEQMGIDAANAIIDLLNGQAINSKVYEPNINFNK